VVKRWWNSLSENQKGWWTCWGGLLAWAALVAVMLFQVVGCASVKPYVVCKVADGHAQVQQGIMGVGVGQDLPDADQLCKKGQ